MRNIINIFEYNSSKTKPIVSDELKAEIERIVLETIKEQLQPGGLLHK